VKASKVLWRCVKTTPAALLEGIYSAVRDFSSRLKLRRQMEPCLYLTCVVTCRAISVCLPLITEEQVLDVKALRAFRVLRPLKLVSGFPSEHQHASRTDSRVDVALTFPSNSQ